MMDRSSGDGGGGERAKPKIASAFNLSPSASGPVTPAIAATSGMALSAAVPVSATFSMPWETTQIVVGSAARVAADVWGAEAVSVEERATVKVRPRRLTAEEQTLVGLIAALGAQYAEMKGAPPDVMLFVGLTLFLLIREFARRVLPPGQ